MLEIVFSESACGALKLAQRYGEGRYRGGAIGVIARNEDGSEPSQEELDKLRREAEERERRAWERAVEARKTRLCAPSRAAACAACRRTLTIFPSAARSSKPRGNFAKGGSLATCWADTPSASATAGWPCASRPWCSPGNWLSFGKPRRTGRTAACCGARKPKDSGGASFCAAAVFIPFSHIPETVPDCGGECRSYGR